MLVGSFEQNYVLCINESTKIERSHNRDRHLSVSFEEWISDNTRWPLFYYRLEIAKRVRIRILFYRPDAFYKDRWFLFRPMIFSWLGSFSLFCRSLLVFCSRLFLDEHGPDFFKLGPKPRDITGSLALFNSARPASDTAKSSTRTCPKSGQLYIINVQ